MYASLAGDVLGHSFHTVLRHTQYVPGRFVSQNRGNTTGRRRGHQVCEGRSHRRGGRCFKGAGTGGGSRGVFLT